MTSKITPAASVIKIACALFTPALKPEAEIVAISFGQSRVGAVIVPASDSYTFIVVHNCPGRSVIGTHGSFDASIHNW